MSTDPLSQIFAAFADPTRRAILARLSEGEASVNEQAAPLKNAADWIGYYRQYWEEDFDRLDAYLKTVTSRQKKKRGKKDGRHS